MADRPTSVSKNIEYQHEPDKPAQDTPEQAWEKFQKRQKEIAAHEQDHGIERDRER